MMERLTISTNTRDENAEDDKVILLPFQEKEFGAVTLVKSVWRSMIHILFAKISLRF